MLQRLIKARFSHLDLIMYSLVALLVSQHYYGLAVLMAIAGACLGVWQEGERAEQDQGET